MPSFLGQDSARRDLVTQRARGGDTEGPIAGRTSFVLWVRLYCPPKTMVKNTSVTFDSRRTVRRGPLETCLNDSEVSVRGEFHEG